VAADVASGNLIIVFAEGTRAARASFAFRRAALHGLEVLAAIAPVHPDTDNDGKGSGSEAGTMEISFASGRTEGLSLT